MTWIEVELDGKRTRVAAARTRDGVWIGWAGRTIYMEEEKRRAAGRSREAAHDEIRAPMTGKVVAIGVAAGDTVAEGAVLVVLEAMKMEYRLTAPRAGVVEKIQCAEGELVDLGKALVTLVEAPATEHPVSEPPTGTEPPAVATPA